MSSTTVTNLQILQPPAVTKRNSNGSPKARKPPKDSSKGRSNARRNNGPVEAPNRTSVDEQLTFKVEKELVEKPVVTSLACVKGQPTIRRAGEYILGPEVGNSPIKTITSYLARKDQTDDFYIIRMLTLKASNEKDTIYDIQGKSLLHTEHSLSSLLSQETGIVHQHGMFRVSSCFILNFKCFSTTVVIRMIVIFCVQCKVDEIRVDENGEMRTEQLWKLCLVLDCYMAHDFSPKYSNIISMHHYVIKQKRLPEAEAIRIFYKVVEILDRLHKRNVVHRDIKPGSIILNRETGEVTLANFCLGQHVTGDNDLLVDRRGSPAHVSPDIVNGKPYLAKPSDLWSMGITLFIMLYGRFPFYDKDQAALFAKIRKGEFTIPK
ncbi:Serine/threonine-protein kinase 40 [Orchesella cincta]|uniref:Serine/threonine-protein kinase 40 n=1 Tax=Orchesella cincta TaxID=48709 RepID=A0A1D2M6V5_ORCCI|nr:Serine/threonine-protein kinase 40 [Orchesella cincta]